MDHRPDASDEAEPPPPETLRARQEEAGLGRFGRLRSWATVLVGLLALGLLYLLMGQTA